MANFEPATATTFFRDADQIGLLRHTHLSVAAEGIVAPNYLVEFTKDSLESVFLNLQKPPKRPNMGALKSNHMCIEDCKVLWTNFASRHLSEMSWAILKNF